MKCESDKYGENGTKYMYDNSCKDKCVQKYPSF